MRGVGKPPLVHDQRHVEVHMYAYKKLKNKDGSTVDEHRVIASATSLGPDYVVHHIDGGKRNNDPKNLVVMTRSEHAKLHGLGTNIKPPNQIKVKPDENGNYKCSKCGQVKKVFEFVKNKRRPYGFEPVCKECNAAWWREKYKQRRGEL